jgi:hypothetical protein
MTKCVVGCERGGRQWVPAEAPSTADVSIVVGCYFRPTSTTSMPTPCSETAPACLRYHAISVQHQRTTWIQVSLAYDQHAIRSSMSARHSPLLMRGYRVADHALARVFCQGDRMMRASA